MAAVVAALFGLLLLLGAGPGECGPGHEGHSAMSMVRCAPSESVPVGCCAGQPESSFAVSHPRWVEEWGVAPLPAGPFERPVDPAGRALDLPPPRPSSGRATLTGLCVSRT
ncbi:hypothetical protein CFP65_5975 [Kitasatospora sp. MMS16-BH015]|nr:hypothetical protein CFP65_5975 [Kitasatospora sp. MMS16-BH015]